MLWTCKQKALSVPPAIENRKSKSSHSSQIEVCLKNKDKVQKKSQLGRPLVSIVTVVRNGELTLEQTIKSVIDQTYDNIEYIIIDGDSTDKTIDIIKKYQWAVKWISEQDKGIYDAMNKGIEIASGDIIGIINSDDFYLERAVEKIVSEAVKYLNSDIFYGNIIYNIPGRPLRIVRSKHPLRKSDFCYMPVMHPAVFIRRSCYRKYGAFDLRYRLSADHDLMLRLLAAKVEFHYLDETIAQMQACGASTENLEGMKEIRRILLKHNSSPHTFLRFTLSFSRVAIIQSLKKWKVTKELLYFYRFLKDLLRKPLVN